MPGAMPMRRGIGYRNRVALVYIYSPFYGETRVGDELSVEFVRTVQLRKSVTLDLSVEASTARQYRQLRQRYISSPTVHHQSSHIRL